MSMTRIAAKFKEARKALIAYITAGDPELRITAELVKTLAASGADIIELGVPFSDPLADGPTIQAASQRALASGTSLNQVIELVSGIRAQVSLPLVLMSYYNPIYKFGIDEFVIRSSECGIDGVIIPDLPPEDAEVLIREARHRGLDTIFLLAPTSTEDRIKLVCQASTGFIYCVSLTGVTGARAELAVAAIESLVTRVYKYTTKPVCVGFGVSNPRQAKTIASFADGVIVGSAIVELIEKQMEDQAAMLASVAEFTKSLKAAVETS